MSSVNSESRPKLQGPPLMCDGITAHARSLQIKNTPGGKARGTVVECEICGELELHQALSFANTGWLGEKSCPLD